MSGGFAAGKMLPGGAFKMLNAWYLSFQAGIKISAAFLQPSHKGLPMILAISPMIPRRNVNTQITKIRPWITVTQDPRPDR